MFEYVVLYFALSRPMVFSTREERHAFSFDSSSPPVESRSDFNISKVVGIPDLKFGIAKEFSTAPTTEAHLIVDRFRQLADDWSSNTNHISSIDDLTSYPSYREIIGLGWDVVPFLLKDLQENKRFWFPALAAITNVRPFDSSDAGNGKRMTDAWIRWGKRKGLI